MAYEVEQKFTADDVHRVETGLERLGASIENTVAQSDLYLRHPVRDFAATDEAFRIRRAGDRNFITYKGPKIDATTKTRLELEVPLAPGAEVAARTAELFERLGFGVVAEVRKQRRHARVAWRGAELEVALDEVEGVGAFVEIEATAEQDGLEAAREQVASLARELGLTTSQRKSYLELLLEARPGR